MLASAARARRLSLTCQERDDTKHQCGYSDDDVVFYWSRPLGAPLGTIRLSLQQRRRPQRWRPSSSSGSVSTPRRRTAGAYWTLARPWRDLVAVIEHERPILTCIEFSGEDDPEAWKQVPLSEWKRACVQWRLCHNIESVSWLEGGGGGMDNEKRVELLQQLRIRNDGGIGRFQRDATKLE